MNCIDVRENLSLYIDGELEGDQIREIAGHLDKCDECRRECDELIELTTLLREIPDACLPESFDMRLKEAIRKEKTVKISASKKRWRMITSIAAVFVIGIFSIAVYNNSNMPAQLSGGAGTIQTSQTANMSGEPAATAGEEDLNAVDSALPAAPDNTGQAMKNETQAENPPAGARENSTADNVREKLTRFGRDLNAETEAEHYLQMIGNELKDLDYKVTDYHEDENGVWKFDVEINTVDELNESYIEKYTYSGQDGKIWREESSSSTETAY